MGQPELSSFLEDRAGGVGESRTRDRLRVFQSF
jgi:hypothetical protein